VFIPFLPSLVLPPWAALLWFQGSYDLAVFGQAKTEIKIDSQILFAIASGSDADDGILVLYMKKRLHF
jgi:hypothetical protein